MLEGRVHIEKQGVVTILRLERGPANAIDLPFARQLDDRLAELETDSKSGALILTGTGSCFSAGLDLKLIPEYDRAQQRELVEVLNRFFLRLYAFPLPTVAALNGHAMAGGMILTLCCDYRIAKQRDCKCGLAEVRVGIPYPESAISVILAELNHSMRRRMGQLGESMSSKKAKIFGIIDEVVPGESVMSRALEKALELAEMPAAAYSRVKRQIRAQALTRMESAVEQKTDPALDSWMTRESAQAAAEVLSGKRKV